MGIQNIRDIEKFSRTLEIQTKDVIRVLAIKTHGSLTKRTPVDTGRARANWQVNVGAPASGVLGEKTKGTGAHKESTSPPVQPQAPEPDMSGYSDLTQPVYITNNLDYIEALENGSSKQAPAGMVALALAEIQGEIDAIIAANL